MSQSLLVVPSPSSCLSLVIGDFIVGFAIGFVICVAAAVAFAVVLAVAVAKGVNIVVVGEAVVRCLGLRDFALSWGKFWRALRDQLTTATRSPTSKA